MLLGETDLAQLTEREMARARRAVSLVDQDPMSSLNPVHSIGRQIVEAIRAHEDVSNRVAAGGRSSCSARSGLPNPARRFGSYPHQFSGGMRQRVMIAMAISANPDVLIADEPTTALDVTTQARIMDLLSGLVEEREMAVILITHDLSLAASFCDDIQVMYAGRIVERSRPRAVVRATRAPVHRGPAERDLPPRRDVDEADLCDPGPAAAAAESLPSGLSVPPALPACVRPLLDRRAVPHVLPDGRMAECHLAEQRATVAA